MKKIYIDKNDTASAVVEKVVEAEDKDIILYIPRFTKLVSSVNNFRVLKREFDSIEKNIEIESVDDDVLDMAKTVGLTAGNPFFRKNRRSVSDIVMPSEKHSHAAHHKANSVHPHHSAHASEEKAVHHPRHHKKKKSVFSKFKIPGSGSNKNLTAGIVGLLLLLLGGFLAFNVLPRADINVVMDKIEWDFSGNLVASTSNISNSFSGGEANVIAEFIKKDKTMTLPYKASGEDDVKERATGTIKIYNAYSSEQQPIVAKTRFSSPEGKIYRITKPLTIPGAEIVNGEIVPSFIEAEVVSDEPGEEYNIPSTRFRIPGFQGSAKYEGFYAESESAMTGGLVGKVKVATADDIETAKADITKSLENALRAELLLILPPDIKLVDGSSRFLVNEIDVDRIADSSGNFKATGIGTIRAIGFKEEDLFNALEIKLVEEVRVQALKENEFSNDDIDLVLKDGYTLEYGSPKMDFTEEVMNVPLEMKSVWARGLDVVSFKSDVAGKKQKDLALDELPAPGIKSVSVSLWPFWVRTIPSNVDKITVDVE